MERYRFSTDRDEYYERFALPLVADAFIFFATVGAIALVLPHAPEVREGPGWILVACAYLCGAMFHIGRRRFPRWSMRAVGVSAAVTVSAAVWVGGPGPGGISLGAFINLVAIGVLSALPVRATAVYMGVIVIGYAMVLALQDVEGWPSLTAVMAGELIAVVFVAHLLVSRLRDMAMIDELTGLENRRAWQLRARDEIARASRSQSPLTVMIIDMDGFKAVNDDMGHHEGDRVLRDAARAWCAVVRPGDGLGRWGGDEFVALLPNCTRGEATDVVGRMRSVMPEGQMFSAGIARWDGVESLEILMKRADEALYEAKRSGGDTQR